MSESEEEMEAVTPSAVVINTPSSGYKIIVQLSDNLLVESEIPFAEDYRDTVSFLVSEVIRLGDRILVYRPNDMMIR